MFRCLFLIALLGVLNAGSLFGALRLTEVMAAGPGGLVDEDGGRPDWVEIHNPDGVAVNLSGWSLSDDEKGSDMWRFPAVSIPPGGYLVVFCSNKNRAVVGRELHTNFELNDGGETLVLRGADGGVVQALKFGLQFADVAFDGEDYLSPPTPGASNATATVAIVRAPVFSEGRGFKSKAFDLSLSCGTAGARIHYTLDGSDPTAASPLYVKPIRVSKTTPIRAVAMVDAKRDSAMVTSTYLFVGDMVKQSLTGRPPAGWPASWGANRVDYGLDPRIAASGKFARALPNALKAIPTMAITMPLGDLFDEAGGIYANPGEKGVEWERAASIELLNPDGAAGFQVNAGLRIRGGASRSPGNPKHSFRVLMRKEYGAEFLDFPLFGEGGSPKTERFDLRCEQLVAWHYFVDPEADFIRDIFGRTLQGNLGQPHTRSRFYHLVINGQYWGMYQTQERVSGEYAAAYFGGEEEDYDVVKVNFDDDMVGGGTDFVDGSFGAWRRAVAMGGAGFADNENYFRIQGMHVDGTRNREGVPLIEVDNLIDYMLAGIYIAADDSPPAYGTQNNWSAIRSREGKFGFRFFAHDWEISMIGRSGNEDRVGPMPTSNPFLQDGVVIDPTAANPWHFWQAMRANAEFRLRVADRVEKHFYEDGALVQRRTTALWRGFMETIDQAVIGESARWGDARQQGGGPILLNAGRGAGKAIRAVPWYPGLEEDDGVGKRLPNPGPITGSTTRPRPFTRDDWLKACNVHILEGFLADRTRKVLGHLREGGLAAAIAAPGMSPFGGVLDGATNVVLTAPQVVEPLTGDAVDATVYYTTNGSDPRLVGGGVSKRAVAYAAPFGLAKSSTVRARAYHAGRWSALVEAAFEVSSSFGSLRITEMHYNPPVEVGDNGEFIELQNTGTTELNLSGVTLSDGIEFVFPVGSRLAPGAYAVVARDPATFVSRYGFEPFGPFAGRLNNDGETIVLSSAGGSRISSLKYDDGNDWPTAPDGFGHSVVYSGDGDSDEGEHWFASGALGGSPGAGEAVPVESMPVVVNEVVAEAGEVSIELRNVTAEALVLGDWKLMSGATTKVLGGSLVVPAGGRLVLQGSDLEGLVWNGLGGTVALQRPVGMGLRRDAVHRFEHGPLKEVVSYARQVTSEGREFFPEQVSASAGVEETGPKASGIRIVEIHYQPQEMTMGGGAQLAPDLEFIELQNVTDDPIDLAGYRTAGVTFVFPVGAVVPARGLAVLALVEPEVFRGRYEMDAAVPVFGPATGSLDRDGDRVAIEAPVTVVAGAAFSVMEEVRYDTASPWSAMAAGRGHSLQRYGFGGYSAEPGSWGSAVPTPGVMNVVNEPPVVRLRALDGQPGARLLEYEAVASDRDGAVSRIEFLVNGVVVAERVASPARFAYALTRGIQDVWVRVTDDEGAVTLSDAITVDAETRPEGAGDGLAVEYFANADLAGVPTHVETVSELGGDWFHVDPAPGVSRVGFSLRYRGQFLPRQTGEHSFVFLATGGLRVRIGGQLVVDEWDDPLKIEPRRFTVPVRLTATEVTDVVVEYRDTDGLAHLSVRLQEPDSFNEGALLSALLYLPGQDVNAVAVGVPVGIERRYVGQKVVYPLRLLHAPVSDEAVVWSIAEGRLPNGLGLSGDGTLSGVCRAAGVFEFRVRAMLPDARVFERALMMRVVDRAIEVPRVRIVTPKALVVTTRGADLMASGSAISSKGIAAVYYTLNGGLRHRLPGAAMWSVMLKTGAGLVGGRNELAVQAEDEEGRVSSEVNLSFVRQYASQLTVEARGAGSLTRGFLGITTRTVGKDYVITAVPAPGFLFSNWSGDVNGEEPRLSFTMRDDMEIVANFVVSPFTEAAGSYAGLLVNEATLSQNTRLRLRLTLGLRGEVSGMANYDCTSFSIRGRLSPTGVVSLGSYDPKTKRYLALSLGFEVVTGTITASSELFLEGGPIVMSDALKRVQPNPDAAAVGRWNVLLPPNGSSPQGHGFMSLTLSKRGGVTVSGRLPSGVAFTDATVMTMEGGAPIYARLGYDAKTTRKESLTGVAQFPTGRNTILRGGFLWAAALDPYLPASELFARELESEGSLWKPLGRGVPFLQGDPLELRASGGGLMGAIVEAMSFSTATAYVVNAASGERIKLSVNRSLGSVTGSLSLPAGGGKPKRVLSWRGLAHPAMNRVGGFFREPDGSVGNVEVGPVLVP